jgi:hypothetical protein
MQPLGPVAVARRGAPGDERSEALLPSSIPQLEPHRSVFQIHCLREKVDPDRRLRAEGIARGSATAHEAFAGGLERAAAWLTW